MLTAHRHLHIHVHFIHNNYKPTATQFTKLELILGLFGFQCSTMYVHKSTEKFPLSIALISQYENFILDFGSSKCWKYEYRHRFDTLQPTTYIWLVCWMFLIRLITFAYSRAYRVHIANHTQIAYLIFFHNKTKNKTNLNKMHSENE